MTIKAKDIVDEDTLKAWLKTRSVEDARVIASRVALRTVLFGIQDKTKTFQRARVSPQQMTLACFRANFISWAVSRYPTYDMKNATDDADDAVAFAADYASLSADAIAVETDVPSVDAAADAHDALSVDAAAIAAHAALVSASAGASDSSNFSGIALAADQFVLLWKRIRSDAKLLEQGEELFSKNLPGNKRNKFSTMIVDKLNKVRLLDAFSSDGSNGKWGLWLDWYEYIVPDQRKSLFGKENDIELATQKNEFWQGDPDEVMERVAELVGWPKGKDDRAGLNQFIIQLLDESESSLTIDEIEAAFGEAGYDSVRSTIRGRLSELTTAEKIERVGPSLYARKPSLDAADLPDPSELPQQNLNATAMVVNDNGQVDLLPINQQSQLLDTTEQRAEYADLRFDLISALQLGQQLGRIQNQLSAMLESLPEDFEQANLRKVWRAGNRVRRTYDAHSATKDVAEYHEARLEPEAASEVRNILDTFNNFAFVDPNLRERDLRRIAPQDRATVKELLDQGEPLIDDALFNGIATVEAKAEIVEELENAREAGDGEHSAQAEDQAALQSKNFMAAAILGAFQKLKSSSVTVRGEIGVFIKTAKLSSYATVGAGLTGVVGTELLGVTNYHVSLFEFIIRNAEALKTYAVSAYNNPAIISALEWIAKLV